MNGSIGCCPRQECKVDCPTAPSCLRPLKVGRRETGDFCPFDSIMCRGHNSATRPDIGMDAKSGERRKRGLRQVGGTAPWAEDCGVQVDQSGCQPVGTRVGIVDPCPTWWLNGPTGTFAPRCCRTTCAVLRAARFRKATRSRHSSFRTAAVFCQFTWPSDVRFRFCMQCTKLPTVEPQLSVVPSLQTGPCDRAVPVWHY